MISTATPTGPFIRCVLSRPSTFCMSSRKESKQGIKTPQADTELIKQRLKDAQADYAARIKQEAKK
jgi:hypothetical protein